MHIIVENECLDSLSKERETALGLVRVKKGSYNNPPSLNLHGSKRPPVPQRKPPPVPNQPAMKTKSNHEHGRGTDLGEMMLNFDILRAVILLEPTLLPIYSQAFFPRWWQKMKATADGSLASRGSMNQFILDPSASLAMNIKHLQAQRDQASAAGKLATSTSAPQTSIGE